MLFNNNKYINNVMWIAATGFNFFNLATSCKRNQMTYYKYGSAYASYLQGKASLLEKVNRLYQYRLVVLIVVLICRMALFVIKYFCCHNKSQNQYPWIWARCYRSQLEITTTQMVTTSSFLFECNWSSMKNTINLNMFISIRWCF